MALSKKAECTGSRGKEVASDDPHNEVSDEESTDAGDMLITSIGSEEIGGSSSSSSTLSHSSRSMFRTIDGAKPSQLSRHCAGCHCELEKPEVGACAEPRGPPYCTRCRFRFMDPFRLANDAGDMLYLAPVPYSSLVFQLDVPDLKMWRKAGYEVELRMLHQNRTEVDRDHLHQAWTRCLWLNMNGREVFKVKPGLRGQKRRDVPQSISAHLRPNVNEIKIKVDDDHPDNFVVAIVRTLPKSPSRIGKLILRANHAECLRRVQALVAARSSAGAVARGGELECVGDERLPLRCPITLQRIASFPARGKGCEHLQCFDLDAYLVSNYRMKAFNSRWRCPLCSLELRPADLCVDAFVEAILEQTSAAVVASDVAAGTCSTGCAAPSYYTADSVVEGEAGAAADAVCGQAPETAPDCSALAANSVEPAKPAPPLVMEVFVATDGAWRPAADEEDEGGGDSTGGASGEAPEHDGTGTSRRKAVVACVIEEEEEADAGEQSKESTGPSGAPHVAYGPEAAAGSSSVALSDAQAAVAAGSLKKQQNKKKRSQQGTLQGMPPAPGSKRKRRDHQQPQQGVRRNGWDLQTNGRKADVAKGKKGKNSSNEGAATTAAWAAIAAGLKPSTRAPKQKLAKASSLGSISARASSKAFRRVLRRSVPPPKHAIDVDSDAPPEEVSDSGDE